MLSPVYWAGAAAPSAAKVGVLVASVGIATNKPASRRLVKHGVAVMPAVLIPRSCPMCISTLVFNGALSRLQARCLSAMKESICMSMRTKPPVVIYILTRASKSPGENATCAFVKVMDRILIAAR
jgi:hypothetical protein